MQKIKTMLALVAAFICGGAWAELPAPVAHWTSLSEGAKGGEEGTDGAKFTLTAGTGCAFENGVAKITKTNSEDNTGLLLNWEDGAISDMLTIVVKYSGYSTENGNNSILTVNWGANEIVAYANGTASNVGLSANVTSSAGGTQQMSSPAYAMPQAGYIMMTSGTRSNYGTGLAFKPDGASLFKEVKYESGYRYSSGMNHIKIGGTVAGHTKYYRPSLTIEEVTVYTAKVAAADVNADIMANFPEVSFTKANDTDWESKTMPTKANTASVTANTSFVGNGDYVQTLGGKESTVVNVTSASGNIIYGLHAMNGSQNGLGNTTRDIYLMASGGTFNAITGGEDATYNATKTVLTGDTLVNVCGDTVVDYVYGAGMGGGSNVTTTGDTGVVIEGSAQVKGTVAGGWQSRHDSYPKVTGNTTVLVKNVQTYDSSTATSTGNHTVDKGLIVGGSIYWGNGGAGTIEGNSAVVVDIPAETEAATFAKKIVGGSYHKNDRKEMTVKGNSSVTITAPNTVTFNQEIIGGGHSTGSQSKVEGNTSVTINGGTYTSNIYAGGNHNAAPVSGTATLTINNGVFSGASLKGGEATGDKILVVGCDLELNYDQVSGFAKVTVKAGKTFTLNYFGAEPTLPFTVTKEDGAEFNLVDAANRVVDVTWNGSAWVDSDGAEHEMGRLTRLNLRANDEVSITAKPNAIVFPASGEVTISNQDVLGDMTLTIPGDVIVKFATKVRPTLKLDGTGTVELANTGAGSSSNLSNDWLNNDNFLDTFTGTLLLSAGRFETSQVLKSTVNVRIEGSTQLSVGGSGAWNNHFYVNATGWTGETQYLISKAALRFDSCDIGASAVLEFTNGESDEVPAIGTHNASKSIGATIIAPRGFKVIAGSGEQTYTVSKCNQTQLSGAVTLNANSNLKFASAADTVAFGSEISVANNRTVEIEVPASATLTTAISGEGKVVKSGAGSLTIPETFTTTIQLTAGTLVSVNTDLAVEVPENKILVKTPGAESTTYALADAAAAVNGQNYATLDAAFQAAKDQGQTVTLKQNVAGDLRIPEGVQNVDAGLCTIGGEIVIPEDSVLTVQSDERVTKGVSGGGKLVNTSGTLYAKNKSGGYALDGVTVEVTDGTVRLETGVRGVSGNDDATARNVRFVVGASGNLTNYGWVNFEGTIEIESDAEKSVFNGTNFRGAIEVVKSGSGAVTFNLGKANGSDDNKFTKLTVNDGSLKLVSAVTVEATESGNANMKVDVDEETRTYSLAQRDATTVYATANDCLAVALANGTAVTLIDGDAIVLDSDHITGNDVWGLNVTSVSGHDVTLSFNEANLKGGVPGNMNLAITKGVIYLYSDIGAGAKIAGSGKLELTRNASGNATNGSIGNGAAISCAVGILSGSVITINGSVAITGTISCDGMLKLADGATLTVETNLADGKVVSGVATKVVKKVVNEGETTTYTYSLVDASSDKPITPDAGEVVIPVVPETGIAIQPGADVKVPTNTDVSKIKVVYNGVELSKAVEGESGHPKYVDVIKINSKTGAIELEPTNDAKPTVSAMGTQKDQETDALSFTVAPIPGLFYSVVVSDSENGPFAAPEGMMSVQAESSAALTLKIPTAKLPVDAEGNTKKVLFFTVAVDAKK